MTKASEFLTELYGSAYTPVPPPAGTQGDNTSIFVPNPNDAKAGTYNKMDIEDQAPVAKKIGYIIDSLSDDDITDELADIVESYLEEVDPNGDMPTDLAAMMLSLPDCQGLYQSLKNYLRKNNVSYSENPSYDNMNIPADIPSDTYPSGANLVMGGNADVSGGSFTL